MASDFMKMSSKVFEIMSLGNDALMLVAAVQTKNPGMFAMGLTTFVHDLGRVAKIKELDDDFIDELTPELQALTAKIFAKIEAAQ